MDKMLGEVTNIEEVKEKDLVWIERAYRPIQAVETSRFDHGRGVVRLVTADGFFYVGELGEQVIRGHYFLVARRIG